MDNQNQNQNPSVLDDFFSSGKGTCFNFGVNTGVKVKEWSTTIGGDSGALKIIFSKEDSVINHFVNFPKPPMGSTEVSQKAFSTFLSLLMEIGKTYANEDGVKERLKAASLKGCQTQGVSAIPLTDISKLYQVCSTMVEGLMKLCEDKGLFSLEGNLALGYNKGGYLTPPAFGEGGVYKFPFAIGSVPTIPVASDRFFHTRPAQNQTSTPPASTSTSEW